MKRFFRIAFFTTSMYVIPHITILLLLPVILVLVIFNIQGATRWLKLRFVDMLFWTIGKKIKIIGQENLSSNQGYLVVSNYPSFYILFAFMQLFPDAAFVAAAFISRIPVLGRFLKQNGFIFVDPRKPKNTKQAIDDALMKNGNRHIIILPEGGRSPDGDIHEFKRGFVYILKNSGLDLLPITLNGFYKLKPVNRKYLDPDADLEIVIHPPIGNGEIVSQSDEGVLLFAKEIIGEEYRP